MSSADQQYALQQADVWYSRALRQLTALRTEKPSDAPVSFYGRAALVNNLRARYAWEDLNNALQVYQAVADTATDARMRQNSLVGLATTWAARGAFPVQMRPGDKPGEAGSYLRAQTAYAAAAEGEADAEVYGGQAWNAIRLGSWDDALRPLQVAQRLAPTDPRYPALGGLAWWLHSDDFVASANVTLPGYRRSLMHAIELYTQALHNAEAAGQKVGAYYATRSVLYYKLRLTSTAPLTITAAEDVPNTDLEAARMYPDDVELPPRRDADYTVWMDRAIRDMDLALADATLRNSPITETIGYYYWRGRLQMAEALTWQLRLRGTYPWRTIAPVYAGALDDFIAGTGADTDPRRRDPYVTKWLSWSRQLARNAAHLALVEDGIRIGLSQSKPSVAQSEFRRAVGELVLVDPSTEAIKRVGEVNSAPNPDYALFGGFLVLATGQPLVKSPLSSSRPLSATVLYDQAISEIQSTTISYVPTWARATVYSRAACDLQRLLASGFAPESSRAEATTILAKLTELRRFSGEPGPLSCGGG